MVEYRKEPVDCFGLILIVKKNLIGYHSDEVVRRSNQEPWKPTLHHHEPSSNRSKNLWKQISGSSIFYLFLHLELLFFNKFCCLTRQTYSNEIKLESRRSEKKIPREPFFIFLFSPRTVFQILSQRGGEGKAQIVIKYRELCDQSCSNGAASFGQPCIPPERQEQNSAENQAHGKIV